MSGPAAARAVTKRKPRQTTSEELRRRAQNRQAAHDALRHKVRSWQRNSPAAPAEQTRRRQAFLEFLDEDQRALYRNIIIPWVEHQDTSFEVLVGLCAQGATTSIIPLVQGGGDRDRRVKESLYIAFLAGKISLRQVNGDARIHEDYKLVLDAHVSNNI